MAYADLGDLRGYLNIVDASDDALLQEALDDAQAYIDGQTNKHFQGVTGTRYYLSSAIDWRNTRLLTLDSWLLSVTTLTNGDSSGTVIAAANYWLWPFNETPKWGILLKTDIADYWEFDTDYRVSVLGSWGYSATAPDDIRRATMQLAAFYYREKDRQVFDTTAIPEAGVITIPQGVPVGVRRIIDRYQQQIGW